MPTPNYFTTNLYLASYLFALDESAFIGLEDGESSYQKFVFKPNLQSRLTTEVEREYWNGSGAIAPKKYANAIKALKERITHR